MNKRSTSMSGVALGLAVLLCGCEVLSVEPIVPESEATFDPRLLGDWADPDGSVFTVSRMQPERNVYLIGGELLARLGRIGEHLVLELSSRDESSHFLSVTAHRLLVLEIGPDELLVSLLDPDPLQEALAAGEVRLAHRRIDGRDLVLYDSATNVREQLTAYLARPGVLQEGVTFQRVTDESHAHTRDPVDPPCFEAAPWPEADRLFRYDPHWLGGSPASSVDLGDGRILWLFGTTSIDPTGQREPRLATRVDNSVALQLGYDPGTAEIRFYWGSAAERPPGAFLPDEGDNRLQVSSGVRVDELLVLFASRPHDTDSERWSWSVYLVDNPDDEPSAWRPRRLEAPTDLLDGFEPHATVLRLGGYVYAFGGSGTPIESHPIHAARWPEARLREGDLSRPEWWAGAASGWVPDASGAQRWPLFDHGQPNLSIHFDPDSRSFLAVHVLDDDPAGVALRAAPALSGPWSDARMIYRPSRVATGARAHPALTGAQLVLSYTTRAWPNSFRFVRLGRCEQEASP